MVSISIESLSKYFGAAPALDRVNLRIDPGEMFFLLGPSGCGKTTLLRCLAGFLAPEQGHIFFGKEDVTGIPPHQRRCAMMFQNYALWPHLDVAANVAFGLEEQRVPRAEITPRVREALQRVQLEGLEKRRIHELSGGQQQRVALARALVVRPRCLFLDEPLSNLDARLRIEMRTEIRRLCKEFGLTAIYVTHDQKEALSIADRMAVLNSGRIAQCGSPEDVYRRPQSAFVAEFMGETNILSAEVLGKEGALWVLGTAAGMLHAAPPSGGGWEPAVGNSCLVSVRPEAWQLSAQCAGINCISGQVTERIYLGEIAQYFVQTGPVRLRISELNPGLAMPTNSQMLSASVAPRDVVLLPGSREV